MKIPIVKMALGIYGYIKLIALVGYVIGLVVIATFGLDIIETAFYTIEDPVPLLSIVFYAFILITMVMRMGALFPTKE